MIFLTNGLIEQWKLGTYYGGITWDLTVNMETTTYAIPNLFSGIDSICTITVTKAKGKLTIGNLVRLSSISDVCIKGY